MPDQKPLVFLSYCRDDTPLVTKLRDELEAYGIEVWLDVVVLPGQDWRLEIRKAMERCNRVVLCFSTALSKRHESGVYPELDLAIERYREVAPGSIFLIPIRLDACPIPPVKIDSVRTLADLQHIDLFGAERDQNFQRLLQSINHPGSPKDDLGGISTPPVVEPRLPVLDLPHKKRLYGRKEQIRRLVEAIVTPEPEPVVVLGGPGIGKSAICAAAINHDEAVKRFTDRRFFVRCDGVESGDKLIAAIANKLGIVRDSMRDPGVGAIDEALMYRQLGKAPALLVLDNAETPHQADKSGGVQEVLLCLADIPGLALVVSLRGAAAPVEPHWGTRLEVKPLELKYARKAFLAFIGKEQFRDSPKLDTLLNELAGVPLAIRLLAEVAQVYESVDRIFELWREQKLPLQDFDSLIDLCAKSLDKTRDASRLMNLLARLPDGISWAALKRLFPDTGNVAEHALLKSALAFEEGGRLRMYAPIRESIVRRYPPLDPEDAERTVEYFLTMAMELAGKLDKREGAAAQNQLIVESANIEKMLLQGLKLPDPMPAVDVAQEIARMILYSGNGTLQVLKEAHDMAKKRGHVVSQADCARRLGDVVGIRSEHREAMKWYEEALSLYDEIEAGRSVEPPSDDRRVETTDRRIDPRLKKTWCIKSLAETYLHLSEYEIARRRAKEALQRHRELHNVSGEADTIKLLGDIEREAGERTRAEEYYKQAFDLFSREAGAVPESHDLGKPNCLQGLADLALMNQRYASARDLYEEAGGLYAEIGDALGQANCLKGQGDACCELGKYPEAEAYYKQAEDYYARLRNTVCFANLHDARGKLAMKQSRHDEAREQFQKALPLYDKARNMRGKAFCIKSDAELCLKIERYGDAQKQFQAARDLFDEQKILDQSAACTKRLGDIALEDGNRETARQCYLEALPKHQDASDDVGAAYCLNSLGDLESEAEPREYEGAKEYYKAAGRLFHTKEMFHEEARTLVRIGLVELAQGCPGAARPQLESAFALYRQIGSHERAKHLSLLLQAILDESQQCLTDGKIHTCTGRELTYELANNLIRFYRQPGSVIVDREGYTQTVRNKRDASRLTGAATIYYREDQQRKRMISLVVVDAVCNP